jgi:alkylation response protein AidB-like acyl-CoA dehydrogenase
VPDSSLSGDIPTRDELISRAASLVPFLLERADETERNRSMLPDVKARLAEEGLLRILQPTHTAGYGLDLSTHLAVAGELARGCGSSAWLQCLIGNQNSHIAWYPKEAQEEVMADGRPLFVPLVMGPPEIAERVKGGVRLNGRWPYVSGVDQATWMMLSARDPDDHARVLTCLMPRDAGTLDDDWHVMGMRGTGSKTVLLKDVFIPDHRVLSFREAEIDGAPGAGLNPDALYVGAPNGIMFAMVVAGPAIGLARCAIDAYKERLASRWSARMPSSQTEWPASQVRLGQATARWKVARRSLQEAADAFTDQVRLGEAMTLEDRANYRMAVVEVVRQCTDIVYELFCDAGTGVVMEGSVLQRALRDMLTLRSHFMIMPDIVAENAGRIQLDMKPKAPYAGG